MWYSVLNINTTALVFIVCVLSSHSFWTSSSLDVPAGVTQEESHTGFLIHLLSAVHALIFLARRFQPFLSLVDREVEFCGYSSTYNRVVIYFIKTSHRRVAAAMLVTHAARAASENNKQQIIEYYTMLYSTPVAQSAPRNLLTRWDVSSIPAKRDFSH